MFYFYVLISLQTKNLYFGSTSNLKKRLIEHNSGTEQSTKHGMPWEIVYYEAFSSQVDALRREKQIKKFKSSYGFLKKRIKDSLDLKRGGSLKSAMKLKS